MKNRFLFPLIAAAILATGCSTSLNGLFGSGTVADPPAYGTLNRTDDELNTITVYATGKGVPPDYAASDGQAKILAERAAVADACRRLSEKINGVYVQSSGRVDMMSVNSDHITVASRARIRGVEVVNLENGPDEVVTALVKIRLVMPKRAGADTPVVTMPDR